MTSAAEFRAAGQPLRVVVIGPGLMGAQIACEYAFGGHGTTVVARSVGRARRRIDDALESAERHGLRDRKAVAEARAGLEIARSLRAAGNSCDLVVESVVEDFDVKVGVLAEAASRFPAAILATNTSSLSVTRLGAAIEAGGRTLGTHYWNPPLLMPLVEVVAGEETAESKLDTVERVLRALGKQPVRVADVPGFAWNRLQLALLREAVWLVEQGVATPETIDAIVRAGLARRWTLTGPFETVALGGPGTFERVAANLLPALSIAGRIDGLARWVPTNPETLDAIREQRDAGLARELRD